MAHSYLGRDDLKLSLGTTQSSHDPALRRALEGVSEQIDRWVDRRFQPYQATRVYTPRDGYTLSVDDLLSATAVKLDQDADRVYEVTMATSDWELGPANAQADRMPYSWIDMQPNGSWRFPSISRGVQVTGTWGYWQELAPVGARLSAATDATSTSLALASATALQAQQTILIGSEQVYLGELSTAGVALVERGANGTTPAAHTTADAVSVYRYPPTVAEACRLQALRLHKRTDAPLGVVAGGLGIEEGVTTVIRLDPDVEKLLEPYRRFRFLGV